MHQAIRRTQGLPAWWGWRSAFVAAALVALPGIARADTCETIFQALVAQAEAPAVSQTMTEADSPPRRSVTIGDIVYLNDEGTWKTVTLKAGGRLGMLKTFNPDAASLRACTVEGADTIDGKAMTVYSYVTSVPKEMEAFAKSGDMHQKLWVGDADGLPYKTAGEAFEGTMVYDGVTAPVP